MALDNEESMPLPDAETELALPAAAPLADEIEAPAAPLRELAEDCAARDASITVAAAEPDRLDAA